MTDASIEARMLELGYGAATVIESFSHDWTVGRLHALVGPNGSGNSTLLRAIARLLPPKAGAVLLEGKELTRLPTREVARRIAVLPQRASAPDGLIVRELVGFGRHPHRPRFGGESAQDRAAIEEALETAGVTSFVDRPLGTLSGGQRQLAWIAMALAQQAPCLLLDEPTAALDLQHQIDVLDLLAKLRDAGRTLIVVLHDLNLAARYADRMLALKDGALIAEGPPREVMRRETLQRVFDIDAELVMDPRHQAPQCIAYPKPAGVEVRT